MMGMFRPPLPPRFRRVATMAQDMKNQTELGWPKEVRVEDALTFIRIFERADKEPYVRRTTFADLFGINTGKGAATKEGAVVVKQKYTTIIGQLQKVAGYALQLLSASPGPH